METATIAFDSLWNQMHDRLCGFVCSRVSNEQDAEDLLQDIFFRIYQQSHGLRDPNRLESWMYQIARNRVIDHYRGRKAWVDLSENIETEAADEQAAAEELAPHLREMVRGLPEPYREALVLTDFHGLGQRELAARMGISLPGAKSRVQRARQKVKDGLMRCFEFEFDTRGAVMEYRPACCC